MTDEEKDIHKCTTCDEESGYLWDSTAACPDCEKGKSIQLEKDKQELKFLEQRCHYLRKKIKQAKNE